MSRLGGVSAGAYASFNLAESVGDDPAAVRQNWRRWRAAYPEMSVALLKQTHGNVVRVFDADLDGVRPEGDGIVTARRGVALGIFTADCVPVIMLDPAREVAGVLHAGWRGTLANIAAAGVGAMRSIGARAHEVRAALGPAIGLCCFEVDEALADRFVTDIPHARSHRRGGRPSKAYLDLRAIVRGQLERSGMDPLNIVSLGPCTRCAHQRYFSRRAAAGGATGLQMTFVGFAK
jgi:YfiH family protein